MTDTPPPAGPSPSGPAAPEAEFLRHTLATLAYRAEKALRDVPDDFADLRSSPGTRTPLQILAHLGDLLEWGERMTLGERRWQPVPVEGWSHARDRFFGALAALDEALATRRPDAATAAVIFQGPVADALTHVGQISMLRGMAGTAVRPESYARAEIRVGRVGAEQSAQRSEFDGDASAPKA